MSNIHDGSNGTGREPLIIDAIDDIRWTDSADVVVIGYGGAGAVAALRARERGADVIAIDRFDGGGATAFSGGVVYAGATAYQRDAGVDDSVEEMFKYLKEEGDSVVADETLMRFCRNSSEFIEWLNAHGVPFEGSLFTEKTNYPPEGKFLYFSGNERVPHYQKIAKPAPRGHRTVGVGLSGQAYYAALRRAADSAGVRALTHAPAVRLVMDRANRVVGVEVRAIPAQHHARHQALFGKVRPFQTFAAGRNMRTMKTARALEQRFGKTQLIRARSGVIIASGGFINSPDLVAKYLPVLRKNYPALMRLGALGCDGTGIELGQSAGGDVGYMDSSFLARSLAPPAEFLEGIVVNPEGRRFINEDAYSGFLGQGIARQDDSRSWLIVKSKIVLPAIKHMFQRSWLLGAPLLMNYLLGGTRKARSPAALAKKLGIPPKALEATVAEYDRSAVAGVDDAKGKNHHYMHPLGAERLTALNLATGNPYSFTLAFTLGGLVVDETSGAVKRVDGSPIAGLYAAGRSAVGLCSTGYISGMSIGDTVFSGLRAADFALSDGQAAASGF